MASMSQDHSVTPLALGRLPILPRRRHTPAFINLDRLVAAAYEPLAKTEKLLAQRVPDTVAGDVEMLRPFRLRAIRMGILMTA